MNVRRGLLRLWVLFSTVWFLGCVGFAASDWYRVTLAGYYDALDWYHSRGLVTATCNQQQARELQERIAAGQNTESKYDMITDCYWAKTVDGSEYLIKADGSKWSSEGIREIVLWNTYLFHEYYDLSKQKTYFFVDLDGPGPRYIIGERRQSEDFYVSLNRIEFFGVIGVTVPLIIFIFGKSILWVLAGFKP
jgi:hypothetical protein